MASFHADPLPLLPTSGWNWTNFNINCLGAMSPVRKDALLGAHPLGLSGDGGRCLIQVH